MQFGVLCKEQSTKNTKNQKSSSSLFEDNNNLCQFEARFGV